MKIFKSIALVSLIVLLMGCNNSSDTASNEAVPKLASGVEQEHMDTSVRPQDDFYSYVNGTWMKNAEIASNKNFYYVYHDMQKNAESSLKDIVKDASKSTEAQEGSNEQIIGDLYASFIDADTINSKGISPLQGDLDAIAEASTHEDIITLMAELKIKGTRIPFNFFYYADKNDTTRYITYFWQPDLLLPEKEHYSSQDETHITIREKSKSYINDIMGLSGYEDTELIAKNVLELETQLSQIQWSDEANNVLEDTFNRYTLDDAKTLLGDFDFEDFLSASGLDISEMIIEQPSYFQEFGKIFAQTSVSVWKEYLAFLHIDQYGWYLSDGFIDLETDFFYKTLQGQEKLISREDIAFSVTGAFSEILGELYAEKNFSTDGETKVQEIAQNIKESFKNSIRESEWLQDTTKGTMVAKIDKVSVEIVYSNTDDIDYSDLEMKADDLVGNITRLNIWTNNKYKEKLAEPVESSDNGLESYHVYFYYEDYNDTVMFTPAVLQTPIFQVDADDAVNYASVGTSVAFFISKTFTSSSNDKWETSDLEGLEEINEKLTTQYGAYNIFEDNVTVFGSKSTLQDIMDELVGVNIAYQAYKNSLNGESSSVVDGYTGEQRFFIGFTQGWREKLNSEGLLEKERIPSIYQVNGTLINMPEFHEAFDVKEGDEMYKSKEEMIKIW